MYDDFSEDCAKQIRCGFEAPDTRRERRRKPKKLNTSITQSKKKRK